MPIESLAGDGVEKGRFRLVANLNLEPIKVSSESSGLGGWDVSWLGSYRWLVREIRGKTRLVELLVHVLKVGLKVRVRFIVVI